MAVSIKPVGEEPADLVTSGEGRPAILFFVGEAPGVIGSGLAGSREPGEERIIEPAIRCRKSRKGDHNPPAFPWLSNEQNSAAFFWGAGGFTGLAQSLLGRRCR